jgi:hypothetical protein
VQRHCTGRADHDLRHVFIRNPADAAHVGGIAVVAAVTACDPMIEIAVDDGVPADDANLQGQVAVGGQEFDLHVVAVLGDHRHPGDGVADFDRRRVRRAGGG